MISVFLKHFIFNRLFLIFILGLAPSIMHTRFADIFAATSMEEEEGIPMVGSRGVSLTTAELMAQEEALMTRELQEPQEAKKVLRADRDNLPLNPHSPLVSHIGSTEEEEKDSLVLTRAMSGPHKTGIIFTGSTLAEAGAFPPDSMGAVGPTQYIVAINGRIKSFNKTTGAHDGVLNVSANTFFQTVRNNVRTSDPRIRYDRLSQRWFVIIINVAFPNRILIAASTGPIITTATSWKFFYLEHSAIEPAGDTTALADYPTLGIDAHALYIGTNNFALNSSGGEQFTGSAGYVIRKSSLLGSGPVIAFAFRNLLSLTTGQGLYTPQGVDNFDVNPTYGYFIGVDGTQAGLLVLRRVSNPGQTPTISGNINVTVPATRNPIKVPHLGNTNGTSGYLDALDDRLLAAHIRHNHVYTAHTVSVDNNGISSTSITPTRNGCRWYDIDLTPANPLLYQVGTLYTPTTTNTTDQRHYWMPSVMTSGQGHMVLGCSTAGINEFANAAFASRLTSTPLGTLNPAALYTTSNSAYNPPQNPGGSGGRRWGDYSYTSLDPADNMTLWTIQEFTNATNSWGVSVAQIMAPPPATPVSVSPAIIPKGQPSITITITGNSVNGSGFYDAGSSFSRRLSARLTGNITVNCVTYENPTTVSLNISTVSASTGPQSVTIVNPDGQQATGVNLITVI